MTLRASDLSRSKKQNRFHRFRLTVPCYPFVVVLLIPDTDLGENLAVREASDEQATTYDFH